MQYDTSRDAPARWGQYGSMAQMQLVWQLIWSWQEVRRARGDNEGRVEAQAVVAVQLATGAGAACQAAHSDRERARTVRGGGSTQHEHKGLPVANKQRRLLGKQSE